LLYKNIKKKMRMMTNNKYIVLSLFLIIAFALNGQALSIKVMSMNIREGGELAKYDAEAFSACIRTYNPDVVVFQEMDNFTTRNGKKDLLSEMAVKLGLFPYFGKAFSYDGGDFGNAILSKYPFFNAKNITSQPAGAKEMRACAWIDILMPDKQKVRVAVTHLDVASDEQVRISTLATINSNILINNTIPTLLIGDFNASPNSDTMTYAKIKWQDIGVGTGNTINSTNPISRIDFVMGYPKNWVKKNYEIVCYPTLSDHCFIVAELEYPSFK
jgi:endonuclease/exonuclease/phosphatase family metal-dependent hydrolase